MTSVGGHSALRGTTCTRAECPGGHCALGQDVRGDILHGGTSCPPTTARSRGHTVGAVALERLDGFECNLHQIDRHELTYATVVIPYP